MTSLHDLTARTPGLPCRTDPEPWFSPDPTARQYAVQQCRTACPLLAACLQHAFTAGEQSGVWGGVDMDARTIGCGTERGFRVHKRRSEEPCESCQAAHDEAVETDRRRRLAAEHAAGGSLRGYWMHRRLGEDACVPCKRAQARRSQERRDEARAAAGRARGAWGDSGDADDVPGAQAGVHGLAAAS
ncbi:WhiB family transcriptional regulator [Streptomyces sp. NPDC001781]